MFAETFAEVFRQCCQSAASLLPFPSSEERLYLEHITTRSRFSTWAFVASFNVPFLISEVIYLIEMLEVKEDLYTLVHFACAMTLILLALLLPWFRGRKASLETLWALLLCCNLAALLTRPVVIIEGRHMGQVSRLSMAELLVVSSFSFLPLRFCVALPLLILGMLGMAAASYLSGEIMDPLMLALVGSAAIYNLALMEGSSRRKFRSESNTGSVAVQASDQDFQRKSVSHSLQVRSSDTFQELCMPEGLQRQRDSRRHRSLPTEEKDGKWATAVQKFRSDGHVIKGAERMMARGNVRPIQRGDSLESAWADFQINVVPHPSQLLGSQLVSQSNSVSNFRTGRVSPQHSPGIASITSSLFSRKLSRLRPEGDAPRLGGDSPFPPSRNSLSVSKSSEGSGEASDVKPMMEDAQCQTEILWKDGGWHCTRCSKPPAPLAPGEPKRSDRRRSKGQSSGASVEAWKRAMAALTHLQGSWRMVYGPENVSPWLEHFMICGTTVCCQDTDRSIEMVEVVQPALAGGMLLLDKDDLLHRFGKTGQHLMFQRQDVTNLSSLVNRLQEDHDPQWFAARVRSGEIGDISFFEEEMQELDGAGSQLQ